MSLSNSTGNLLRTQYFDDWYAQSNTDPSLLRGDEFDFHRMLFRPKFAVQSRELTQLQTILQAQLERFGKSAFRDGEAVLGGNSRSTRPSRAAKCCPRRTSSRCSTARRTPASSSSTPTNTGIKAHVLQFVGADEGTPQTTTRSSSIRPRTRSRPARSCRQRTTHRLRRPLPDAARTCSHRAPSSASTKVSSSSLDSSSAWRSRRSSSTRSARAELSASGLEVRNRSRRTRRCGRRHRCSTPQTRTRRVPTASACRSRSRSAD
jgi:hypothetical protein